LPGEHHKSLSLRIPLKLTLIFAALSSIGAIGFLVSLQGANQLRAWQAYLVNFLFWTGLSFGAVLFVAVLNITGAKWGRPLKRLGEAFSAYLPIGFLLFWPLYFGRTELFPWIHEPVPGREIWLNVPFLFIRNGIGLFLLTLICVTLVIFSIKADRLEQNNSSGEDRQDAKPNVNWKRQLILSPILGIFYAFVMTLMGLDLVMSLDPHWCSTLLGVYFFIGSFYTGIAAIYLLSFLAARSDSLKNYVRPRHFHDLGKLLFAFCLFTGYLFYVQFLTIWYGNMPEETRYVILRVKLTPWEPLAWVVLFMIFLIPFVVLLSRKIKVKRLPMTLLSLMVITGMWLERFILVAPSLWKQGTLPLGITELSVTAGYLGIMGLCLTAFLRRFPTVPLSDPLFMEAIQSKKERFEP
jgi:hypothetical protein